MNCDDYFNQIAKPGKCEVCGAEKPIVVLSSSFGACSCAYCKECYNFNLEPYDLCVSTVWSCGWQNMSERAKNTVEKSLIKIGKTFDEMMKDVKKIDQDYLDWCNRTIENNRVED